MSFKYWAFISYSHKDEKQSKWLHRAIENYRVPKHLIGKTIDGQVIPKKITPVFRDREELPASSDLNNSIKEALRNSRTLVVLSSPSAAKSKWVNEEIRVFKSFGENQRVLTTILDGEPNASDKEDESKEECFPEALKYKVDTHGQISDERVEPIAADLRPGKDGKLNTKLKTIAGILGVSFDELKRRDQRRRVIRNSWLAATVFVVLVTIALLAMVATEQSHKALENKIAGMQTLATEYLSAEAIPEGLTVLAEIAKISDGQSKDQALLSASYLLSRLLSIEDILKNAPSDSLVFEWRDGFYLLLEKKEIVYLGDDEIFGYWIDRKTNTLVTIEKPAELNSDNGSEIVTRSLTNFKILGSYIDGPEYGYTHYMSLGLEGLFLVKGAGFHQIKIIDLKDPDYSFDINESESEVFFINEERTNIRFNEKVYSLRKLHEIYNGSMVSNENNLSSGSWTKLNSINEYLKHYLKVESFSFPKSIPSDFFFNKFNLENAHFDLPALSNARFEREEIVNNLISSENINDFIDSFEPTQNPGYMYYLNDQQNIDFVQKYTDPENSLEYLTNFVMVSGGRELFFLSDDSGGNMASSTTILKMEKGKLVNICLVEMIYSLDSSYVVSDNGRFVYFFNPGDFLGKICPDETDLLKIAVLDIERSKWLVLEANDQNDVSRINPDLFSEKQGGFLTVNGENVLFNFSLSGSNKIILENSFHISDEYIAKDIGEEGCEESWGIAGQHMKRQLEYISADIALIASKGHKITAVDLNTGHMLWSKKNPLNLEKCDLHKDLKIVSDIEAGVFAVFSEKRARIYSSIYGTPITGIINVDILDVSLETEEGGSQSMEYQDEQTQFIKNIFFLKNGSFLLKTTHSYYLSFPPFSKEETMEMLRNIGKYTGLKYKDELETLKILPGVQPNKEFMTEIEN